MNKYGDFFNDQEKMRDMAKLSKEEFLRSYSYLTEEEYDNTLNKVIIKVLTTPLKRDAKLYHNILKQTDYEVFKAQDNYRIRNCKTGRQCAIFRGRTLDNKVTYLVAMHSYTDIRHQGDPMDIKVNFVNYLNKPINIYTSTAYRWEQSHNNAAGKLQHIRDLERRYKTGCDYVNGALKRLEIAQKSLISAVERREGYKAELNNFRKECGLR